MSAARRMLVPASSPRRPLGPRCHGGASSLLRLGFGAAPQRPMRTRVSGWMDLGDAPDAARVEHVVGWPVSDERRAVRLS
jgi:hypothetical protein